jgi:hypothetical protein
MWKMPRGALSGAACRRTAMASTASAMSSALVGLPI